MSRLNNELGSREIKGCAVNSHNEAGLVPQLLWFVASFLQQNLHLNRRLKRYNYSLWFAIIINLNFSKKKNNKNWEKKLFMK